MVRPSAARHMNPRARLLLLVCAIWLNPENSRSKACEIDSCPCDRLQVTCRREGGWHIAESENFKVCSLRSAAEADAVTRRCECLRRRLIATWNESAGPWSPKCQVVLFPTASDYVRSVGAVAGVTAGSSLVQPNVGAVTTRRIDLRADVDSEATAALPHELCHVVLADQFRRGAPPLWFDEGVALQYDSPAKQQLHRRDLQLGLARGTAYTLSELLALRGYPPPGRWGVFYGQSAALVERLLERGTADQLMQCAAATSQETARAALRDQFGVRDWRDVALLSATPASATSASATPGRAPTLKLVSVASTDAAGR
jgi:hypothetical protein